MRRLTTWATPWIALACLAPVGCGGSANQPVTQEQMETNTLSDVGEMYRLYQQDKGKAPQKLADFAPMEPMSPSGYNALKQGTVVVRYGATMPDTLEGPSKTTSNEVLAYYKEVPEKGGAVMMLDRSIKNMTVEEFNAAPKAGKEPAAATKKK